KLEEDPLELDREVDWVIKRKLLEAYRGKHGLRWDDHRILMMDLQYHDLRPDKGLYYLLERQGKVERVVTDEEIRHATEHPPTGTRAYFRGACLRKFGPEVFGVNWDSISFCIGNQPIKRVLMAEPARGSKFHVGELIERSETVEALIANLAS
ncbi:MAG: proteasome accessory factor PafA2 family protein, partial [Deltaproteobacteria bacterium]|nr:proteasome accessory factor PafA2 family protein [Deltaproteobacteria bacterium]